MRSLSLVLLLYPNFWSLIPKAWQIGVLIPQNPRRSFKKLLIPIPIPIPIWFLIPGQCSQIPTDPWSLIPQKTASCCWSRSHGLWSLILQLWSPIPRLFPDPTLLMSDRIPRYPWSLKKKMLIPIMAWDPWSLSCLPRSTLLIPDRIPLVSLISKKKLLIPIPWLVIPDPSAVIPDPTLLIHDRIPLISLIPKKTADPIMAWDPWSRGWDPRSHPFVPWSGILWSMIPHTSLRLWTFSNLK